MDKEQEETLPAYYGSPDQFNFNPDFSKSARIEENYARSSNFIAYLKDITRSTKDNVETVRLTRVDVDGEEPEDVDGIGNESGELESVWQYLDNFYEFGEDGNIDRGKNVLPIDLDKTKFQPINTECLPDLKSINSAGSIVLIEFFTHCCINCIHSIEDVRHVYEDLTTDARSQWKGNELRIISIHSPKFTREKELESIKAFTEQFQMDYSDVVNDPGCLLWNELGISCWPTLLMLGPNPEGNGMNLLFTMMGEGHKHVLKLILSSAVPFFRHKLRSSGDSIDGLSRVQAEVPRIVMTDPSLGRDRQIRDSILRYPGKVACNGEVLAVADTGNHRIIISDVNGFVKQIIGGSEKGDVDGTFLQAKFHFPQGIVFKEKGVLFVADTGNHSIRCVSLTLGTVTTLIPHGWNYIHDNETIHLRSPWDLTCFNEEILIVAAAGNHRIFAYFFESSKLFTSEFDKGTFTVIAGNGKEENRNNAYILKASFAQPSGICVINNHPPGSKTIFIADSESSSIRSITTEGKGKVSGVIGGAKDPTDLFSYGDEDGKGVAVKLQHPMGVCSHNSEAQIFLVDTYNNKVKVMDINSQTCATLCGNGTPGDEIGEFASAKFNEPGGICMNPDSTILYIADTNNHAIKSINLVSNVVQNVAFTLPSATNSTTLEYDDTFSLPFKCKSTPACFSIAITNVPENFEGGQWRLNLLQEAESQQKESTTSGEIVRNSSSGVAVIAVQLVVNEATQYSIIADIFLCGSSSCYKRSLKFLLKIVPHENVPTIPECFTYTPKTDFFI